VTDRLTSPVPQPLILPWRGVWPKIADDVFVAPNATVIGDVEIGAGASIWFNTVLRGDVFPIRVGAGTNIQDGSVVHVTTGRHATHIGANVLVGHRAVIHGCVIEDLSFVGMSATVMDGCVIETGSMLAAGALLSPGKRIPSGQLWAGQPARYVRQLEPAEVEKLRIGPEGYAVLAQEYRQLLLR